MKNNRKQHKKLNKEKETMEKNLNEIFDRSKNIGEIANFGHLICKDIREENRFHISIFLMKSMDLDGTPFFRKKLSHFTANSDHFKTSVVFYNKDLDEYETINMTDEAGKILILTNIVQNGKRPYVELPIDKNYFLLKAVIERLSDQCKDFNKQIKAMLKTGILYPEEKESSTWPMSEKKDIEVDCFKVELDWHLDENNSKYKQYKQSQENLVKLTNLRNLIIYKTNKIFSFYTRCYEYWLFNMISNNYFPEILNEFGWEYNIKPPRKRIEWDQLMVTTNVTLRCRCYKKTI